MTAHAWELAHFNLARLRQPLEDPRSAGFAEGIEAMNALGEASPGFVWRLRTEAGDATSLRVPPDPQVIVNLTVWTDVESLKSYAYRSGHGQFVRRRREWFEHRCAPSLVLWWVPVGERPTLADARARLAHLTEHGPTPWAFTFASVAEPPQ